MLPENSHISKFWIRDCKVTTSDKAPVCFTGRFLRMFNCKFNWCFGGLSTSKRKLYRPKTFSKTNSHCKKALWAIQWNETEETYNEIITSNVALWHIFSITVWKPLRTKLFCIGGSIENVWVLYKMHQYGVYGKWPGHFKYQKRELVSINCFQFHPTDDNLPNTWLSQHWWNVTHTRSHPNKVLKIYSSKPP